MATWTVREAVDAGARVFGGEGEDRDYGRLYVDGDRVMCAWESEIVTHVCSVADLDGRLRAATGLRVARS